MGTHMNADLRAALVTEPRPFDAMDCRLTLDGRGWRLTWVRGGRTPEVFGPPFRRVSQAAAAASYVRHQLGLD